MHRDIGRGLGADWQFAQHWTLTLGGDEYPNLGNENRVGETSITFTNIGLR